MDLEVVEELVGGLFGPLHQVEVMWISGLPSWAKVWAARMSRLWIGPWALTTRHCFGFSNGLPLWSISENGR